MNTKSENEQLQKAKNRLNPIGQDPLSTVHETKYFVCMNKDKTGPAYGVGIYGVGIGYQGAVAAARAAGFKYSDDENYFRITKESYEAILAGNPESITFHSLI